MNNLADAKVIAASYGITDFHITGTLVVGPGDNLDGLNLHGENSLTDVVALVSGCSTVNTVFRDMTVTGVVGGPIYVEKCACVNLSNIGSDAGPSLFNECILIEGTFAFQAGLTTPGNIQFTQCLAGVKTAGGVVVNYNGTTTNSAFRKFSGAVTVTNHSAAATSVWEFDAGDMTIDASCTAGTMLVRGLHSITNNGGGVAVDIDGALFPPQVRSTLNAILGLVV